MVHLWALKRPIILINGLFVGFCWALNGRICCKYHCRNCDEICFNCCRYFVYRYTGFAPFQVARHLSQRLFAPAPFPRRTHGSGDKPLCPAVASPGQSRLIQLAEKCHGMGLLMRISVPIPHGMALPNE